MTATQHARLLRVLAKALGTDRILLVGDQGLIKIVTPKMTYLLAPRGYEPSRLRNRYFSLSFGHEAVCEKHEPALKRLQEATQSFARRNPWLIEDVAEGRVFIRDTPATIRYFASAQTKYGDLFRELKAFRKGDAAIARLVDNNALRTLFLRLAGAYGRKQPLPPSVVRPLKSKPHHMIFLNFLGRASGLGEELSRWAEAADGNILCTPDWRLALKGANRNTVLFCFGLQENGRNADCVRVLLRRKNEFRHIVFADIGITFDPQPLPNGLLRDPRLSFFLSGPVNYFGALHASLPAGNRLPYIPLVSRAVLNELLPLEPSFDFFFCAQSHEQGLQFLLRHEAFFRARKLLIGTKGNFNPAFPDIRQRFPNALFIPRVSQSIYLNLWRLARNIVIMYPEDWRKTSFTMTAALLCGRGIITSAHPAIAALPASCFLLHAQDERMSARRMKKLYCNDRRSLAAARRAEAFARRSLEFTDIVDTIVRGTLRRLSAA